MTGRFHANGPKPSRRCRHKTSAPKKLRSDSGDNAPGATSFGTVSTPHSAVDTDPEPVAVPLHPEDNQPQAIPCQLQQALNESLVLPIPRERDAVVGLIVVHPLNEHRACRGSS